MGAELAPGRWGPATPDYLVASDVRLWPLRLGSKFPPDLPNLLPGVCSAPFPQHREWQLVVSVHKPVGTGQAACLFFPGPSLVGWTSKYCVTQPKNSFPCLSPFSKGETKTLSPTLLLAPCQGLKCHFSGSCFLPRAGCSFLGGGRGRRALLLPTHGVGGGGLP